MTKLVIVESPTKIKKVQQYLPPDFVVDSCVGHIRDLPSKKSEVPDAIKDKEWSDYGIDYTNGFRPHYITIRGKGKVITELRRKLKNADELYLATDEDREGESISWHLVETLRPKVPVKRMVFNEITKNAVQAAMEDPRDLDMDLVQAQETRRILDRLYGYCLSPLLWKKIGGNLSAGRVQSVATRLVVMRERERRAFRKGSYWDLTAELDQGGRFEAKLIRVDGRRIATGKDFDKDTGKIAAGKDVLLLEEKQAKELRSRLVDTAWTVDSVDHTERTSRAYPPYITSTLQQDANNRLGYGAKRTMDIAQRLYQEGYITYMRTDSTALSEEALDGAKKAVLATFGADHYAGPRRFGSKKAKGAQEAHEAIRPAGDDWKHPDQADLTGDEQKLYRLIWQRTVASQMADERFTSTRVGLKADEAVFVARGKRVDFPGYRAAYPISGDDKELPPLQQGDAPRCTQVDADGRETKPPARYTEATLVKALEEEAIGRPSTYASILDTIQRRGYVVLKGKALVPSFTAFAVVGLLEKHFPDLVDMRFTAAMEDTLDAIAAGDAEWVPFLDRFFLGDEGLKAQVDGKMDVMDPDEAKAIDLGDFPFTVKVGRFGAYVETEVDGETVRASIPEDTTPDELDEQTVEELIRLRAEGPDSIGKDPETGLPVYVLTGRFGPYYQLGEGDDGEKPKRASLPKGKKVEDGDLEEALFLLSLPKVLGQHPDDGGDVAVGLGRFGPYVMHKKAGASKPEYRSIRAPDTMEDMILGRALELLAQPKGGRRGPSVIKDLGDHPKEGGNVQILDGRYGPYVKHEKTNATVPKDVDPNTLSLEQAVELIAQKRAK